MAESIDFVFRDYNTPGNPASGESEPEKVRIRRLLKQMRDTVGLTVTKSTKALLLATVPPTENYAGVVLDDPDPTNNGYYSRVSAAWVWERGFPDTLAYLEGVGGTANAVTASSRAGVDPAQVLEYRIQPAITNTGAVTLSIDGGTPKPVMDVNGVALTAGLWTAGRIIGLFDNGDEYRMISDPDADGAAADAAASAVSADADADRAEVARTAAENAVSALFTNLFSTIAALEAYNPAVAPVGVLLAGNTAEGDIGEVIHLVKVVSEPAHEGKVQDAAGNWYELDRGAPINPMFFTRASHAGDHSLAFSAAADVLIAFGGGTIRYPHITAPLDWNTAVSKIFLGRMKAFVDFGTTKIQLGEALFLGGAYELSHFLSLQGGSAVNITADVTAWYTNYIKVADAGSYGLRVGDRIYISDSVNTWAGGDGRPCHFATVDYIDETNNIINFYPGIAFAVTVSNATTGQINGTGLIVQAYPDDADITVRNGNFYGLRHPAGSIPAPPTAGQVAGGTSAFGLMLRRGRGLIDGCNFYDLCTSLTLREGNWRYQNSENQGTYNGYGIKVVERSHVVVDNCIITGSRHAVGVGGSTPDGATAFVTNSTIGGARMSNASNVYPSEEYGAFDMHPSAYRGEAHNCLLIGGCTHDNGHLKIVGGRLITRQLEGICQFVGNGRSDGSFTLIDVDIEVHPYTPAFDDVDGAGTFGSVSALFRQQTFEGTGNNWRFVWRGGSVSFPRGTSWASPTDFACNITAYIWTHIEIDGVRFLCEGTNIRRIIFNARGDGGGMFIIRDCLFDRVGMLMLNEPGLQAWRQLFIERNKILTPTTIGTAIDIIGDATSTSTLFDIIIADNYIDHVGLTSFITMGATARRSVTVKDNTCSFIAAGAAVLTYGIRTHRNQTEIGQAVRSVADVRGNKLLNRQEGTPNTITTGIQILGLASVGSLVTGMYLTGDNMVETAGTKITTSGTAAVGV